MKKTRPVLLLLGLVVCFIPAWGGQYEYAAPSPGTYNLPVVKTAGDGALIDSAGKAVSLSALTGGRVTILSFIYTRCGDARACPYASSVLNALHVASAKDPELTRELRLVSLSFDPDYDDPVHLADYANAVRDDAKGCAWLFVVPRSAAEMSPILASYNQAVDRKSSSDGTGPYFHTLRVFLIDPHHRIRNIYSTGTLDPRLILADIRTLLLEEHR